MTGHTYYWYYPNSPTTGNRVRVGIRDVPRHERGPVGVIRIQTCNVDGDWLYTTDITSNHLSEGDIWSVVRGGAYTQIARWLEQCIDVVGSITSSHFSVIANMDLDDFHNTYLNYAEEDASWVGREEKK